MLPGVHPGESSLDSGRDGGSMGSPSLRVEVNRAEGHRCRLLAAVAVWVHGRRSNWLRAFGLQLPPHPHFPVTTQIRRAESLSSHGTGNRLWVQEMDAVTVNSCCLIASHGILPLAENLDINWTDPAFFAQLRLHLLLFVALNE